MRLIYCKEAKRNDIDSKATIYVRLRDGRSFDSVTPTELSINPNLWDDKDEQVKSKVICFDELRDEIDNGVRNLKSYIEKEYRLIEKENITKDLLKTIVDKYYNPKKYFVPEAVEVKPTFQLQEQCFEIQVYQNAGVNQ
jgi:intergrase/recombinase